MPDLRWVLLGLGALLVVGVYLWSKGVFSRRLLPQIPRRERTEPSFGSAGSEPPTLTTDSVVADAPPLNSGRTTPDRIITLRLIPRGGLR